MSLLGAAPSAAPAASSGIDRPTFRQVFGRHPGGVVVVTADAGLGPAGLTLTSLTSVAADPPQLSGISHGGSTWPTSAATRAVVVHFLAARQADLGRLFATSGVDRFAHPTRWSRTADGQPRHLEPLVHHARGYRTTTDLAVS